MTVARRLTDRARARSPVGEGGGPGGCPLGEPLTTVIGYAKVLAANYAILYLLNQTGDLLRTSAGRPAI